MKLTVVGCGDAFGSGGRLQTCFHIDTGSQRFLIDCGATTMIGLDRLGLDPNAVGTIFISHLHGDHFSGLVWWLLHAQHVAKRVAPMLVAGPPGIEARFVAAAEALFPGSTTESRRFALNFVEIVTTTPLVTPVATVSAFEVSHPSGAPSYALRLDVGGRTLAFTGDTEWAEALVPAGRAADLYIMECYAFEGLTRYHMTWQNISANLARIGARRTLLTHMSTPMLANRHRAVADGVIHAEDGLVIEI